MEDIDKNVNDNNFTYWYYLGNTTGNTTGLFVIFSTWVLFPSFFTVFLSSSITFSRLYSRKMAEPLGRQRSIINLIFEISRMFRTLWGPFVSTGDINLSDNVLGNAVSEVESHIILAWIRGLRQEKKKERETRGKNKKRGMKNTIVIDCRASNNHRPRCTKTSERLH